MSGSDVPWWGVSVLTGGFTLLGSGVTLWFGKKSDERRIAADKVKQDAEFTQRNTEALAAHDRFRGEKVEDYRLAREAEGRSAVLDYMTAMNAFRGAVSDNLGAKPDLQALDTALAAVELTTTDEVRRMAEIVYIHGLTVLAAYRVSARDLMVQEMNKFIDAQGNFIVRVRTEFGLYTSDDNTNMLQGG